MSIGLTIDSLEAILGRKVEEIHLTVAKSSVLGLDPETIANTIGVPKSEIDELMESQDYKDIRLLVGADHQKDRVERDMGWDGIENSSLRKLAKRVTLENDTDTLLRIAAVANRATRRAAPPTNAALDPSQAGARVPLTLTRRYTEKLNQTGQIIERSETQQISVLNGSAVNPSFKEVSQLLHAAGGSGNIPAGRAEPVEPTERPKANQEAYLEATHEEAEPFDMAQMQELARKLSSK